VNGSEVKKLRMAVLVLASTLTLVLGGGIGCFLTLRHNARPVAAETMTTTTSSTIPQLTREMDDEIVNGRDGKFLADYTGQEGEWAEDNENTFLPDTAPKKKKNLMKIKGRYYKYKDTSILAAQKTINAKPGSMSATWGGKHKLKVNDKKSTHLIGHNPGIFSILFKLKKNSKIVIYDYRGKKRTYKVKEIVRVDDRAYTVTKPKKDYWDKIVKPGNDEQVVFQTCVNDHTNLIVIAK
jgi:hypothetical protein